MTNVTYGWTDPDGGAAPRVEIRLQAPAARPSIITPGTTVSTQPVYIRDADGSSGTITGVEPGPYYVRIRFARADRTWWGGDGMIDTGKDVVTVPNTTTVALQTLLDQVAAPVAPSNWLALAQAAFAPASLAADVAGKLSKTTADASYAPLWQPNTTYGAGARVVNPSGDLVTAKTGFTSGATYSASNWNLSTSYAAPSDIPLYPVGTAKAGRVGRPNIVDIRDYITSGTTFDLAAVVAAMEARNGACHIPDGDWTAATFNVALDSNVAAGASRFTYRFYGAGKNSRILLPAGMVDGDFLLNANSTAANTFHTHPKVVFEDFAVSGTTSPNGGFFKGYQRSFTARRTYFSAIKYGFVAGGYCDLIRLEQVYAEAMTAGGWVYTGVDNGDGFVCDQMMAYACGGINLSGCVGASIRGCVSGWHQFISCDVSFEDCHYEGDGTTNAIPVVTLKGSTARVRSGFYQSTKYRPTFSIDDVSASMSSRVIFHRDVRFGQRLDDPSSTVGAAKGVDIDIINLSQQSAVELNGVRSYAFGQSTAKGLGGGSRLVLLGPVVTASGMSAIQTVLTQQPVRPAIDASIRYGASGWEIVPTRPNHQTIPMRDLGQSFGSAAAAASNFYTTELPAGTYYYRIWARDLSFRNSQACAEISVTTTSGAPLPAVTFNVFDGPVEVRILRGTASGTYSKWARFVTPVATQTVYDQGSYIAGAAWADWSGSPGIPSAETATGLFFVEGSRAIIYRSAPPTAGNYLVGDICWNTAPAAAGVPGWMCVTAGYPGTWKAMPALAA